jgi:hypothetical protein
MATSHALQRLTRHKHAAEWAAEFPSLTSWQSFHCFSSQQMQKCTTRQQNPHPAIGVTTLAGPAQLTSAAAAAPRPLKVWGEPSLTQQ